MQHMKRIGNYFAQTTRKNFTPAQAQRIRKKFNENGRRFKGTGEPTAIGFHNSLWSARKGENFRRHYENLTRIAG